MSDKSHCEETIDHNFVEAINLLNEHDIKYWACNGTLLGLVRDGNLIPWDHDVDIALWHSDVSIERLISLMSTRGFAVKNTGHGYDFIIFHKDGGREVDFNFFKKINNGTIAYSEWYVSKSLLSKILSKLAHLKDYQGQYLILRLLSSPIVKFLQVLNGFFLKRKWLYQSSGYSTPVEYLQEFSTMNFQGVNVRVPTQYEKALEFVYGSDWSVPNRNYDWQRDSESVITD